MPTLSRLQLAGIVRLQRKFKAVANTHGPLRCVLIHKEGEDFRLPLFPPGSEDMPALARERSSLYSSRLYCRGSDGEEILCKTATIGTGKNPYMQLDEPVSRAEQFAGHDIYLLRNHKNGISFWPIDPEVLQADPNWQKLSQQTHKSQGEFWRLAGETGRCFGADDCGVLPEVARESLEASDDGERWLWIVFDLAWQKVKGSPLQAGRWVWHEPKGEGGHFYAWELDFARVWKRESNPGTAPDEAERIENLSYLKAWAERRPGFYYSSLDDLFSASVWAIYLLTLHKADTAPGQDQAEQTLVKQRGGKAKGRKKGKPKPKPKGGKITGKAEKERLDLIKDWEKASESHVPKYQFCEDSMITTKQLGLPGPGRHLDNKALDDVLNWKRKRDDPKRQKK